MLSIRDLRDRGSPDKRLIDRKRFGWLPLMSVLHSTSLPLAILAVSLAPLQAAYIQRISFGFEVAPSFSSEFGHFILQYKPEFAEVSGQNGSINWMTMTVGAVTRDLVRDQVVVADYFGFAFFPATRQVGLRQALAPVTSQMSRSRERCNCRKVWPVRTFNCS